MVEAQDHDRRGQRTLTLTNGHGFPPTVVDHDTHDDGMTLVTLDHDPDTNIEIYDDDRAPHLSGETPDWAEAE